MRIEARGRFVKKTISGRPMGDTIEFALPMPVQRVWRALRAETLY
jgi:hypothetical protein